MLALEIEPLIQCILKLFQFNGPENQFTAAWGYVLNRDFVLAQAVADILLKDRNLSARVIRVTDHPNCNSLKQPDFCIECEGFDILVEHKLNALLHEEQLENYLNLDPARNYVALIGPAYQVVPEVVLGASRYLKPSGKDHFKWSDFHGAVKSRPGWLAHEFAEFMTSLGMAPFTLRGAEDVFDMRQKPVQFEESLKLAANQVFGTGNPGCTFKGTPTGRGREIRTPIPSLTLIYIWAEQQSKFFRDVDGPVLSISVYERNPAEDGRLQDSIVTTESGLTVHRHQLSKPLVQGVGYCRVTYVAPLERIIQETRESTVQCMSEVLEVVRADHWLEV